MSQTSQKNLLTMDKNYFFLIILSFFPALILAQSIGDYGVISNGDWSDPDTWGIWNGSQFINDGTYPGEEGGTYDVYIIGNHTVNLDISVNGSFNSLIIGDEDGSLDLLNIVGNNVSRYLNTKTIHVKTDGQIKWENKTDLSLPAYVNIILDDDNGFYNDTACNVNRTITIGGEVYAVCNGSGAQSFEDINTGGGVDFSPQLSIDKVSITSGYSAVGDVIDYQITVTNTGLSDLEDVRVNDPLIGLNTIISNLNSGVTSGTYTGQYTITQADIDRGYVSNTAYATFGGNVVSSSDGYDVIMSLYPIKVIPSTTNCTNGYNYNVELAYTFLIVGNPPSNLYTLQGNLNCGGQSTFFDLPNAGGSGTTVTVGNQWRSASDCNTVTPQDLDCEIFDVQIQGPGLNYTNVQVDGVSGVYFVKAEDTEIVYMTEVFDTVISNRNKTYRVNKD
ncbi:DUF7507 domain-containing protein [Robertkochia solimangrovi]|uniref:DUF7507 domain-containing protein n=1 Tax=Robertkochia solimangrovi TaxID=2213046 RepID=UPI00117C3437|nr:DUF11 domain-containing protein [Robertkochia solimangrovi]TRZ44186.1 hypothetical protein DMZ48_06635 [Robertkochia solimangrovi]